MEHGEFDRTAGVLQLQQYDESTFDTSAGQHTAPPELLDNNTSTTGANDGDAPEQERNRANSPPSFAPVMYPLASSSTSPAAGGATSRFHMSGQPANQGYILTTIPSPSSATRGLGEEPGPPPQGSPVMARPPAIDTATAASQQETADAEMARRLQAQEMRPPPPNMVIGNPVLHAVDRDGIAGGVPTESPHQGARIIAHSPGDPTSGAILFLATAPSREEQRLIRVLYYSGTVQCIVLLNFVFTFVSIMYPSPYKTALAMIAPLGLSGFVGARKFSAPWLTVYQGYLFIELGLRAFIVFETEDEGQEREDNQSSRFFWLFLFAMVNMYIFVIVMRLKAYITQLSADDIRDLTRGDINSRGRRRAPMGLQSVRYPPYATR
ncbi:unnamed protein product [Amoebophrya sp. A120]|nr:unnamed protein product [Amoebophrya sp. A120]|eukprot:GSA120T00003680001.1